MFKKIGITALVSTLAAGCASVPMESLERTTTAKKFNPPAEGNSGLYIYRNTSFGGAAYKDIWVDGHCIGSTAPYVFFMKKLKVVKATKFRQNLSSPQTTCLLKLKAVCIILFNKI